MDDVPSQGAKVTREGLASVGRLRKALATAVTATAAVAYFLMMVSSEYRFRDLVFLTVLLAAPVTFALGPRRGLIERIGLGFVWMVTVTLLTMMIVVGGTILVGTVLG